MLVLTRKFGESLECHAGGKLIRIVVVGINGRHVRLGIDAPSDVPIVRTELQVTQAQIDAAIVKHVRQEHEDEHHAA